jgi:hypothetical protein
VSRVLGGVGADDMNDPAHHQCPASLTPEAQEEDGLGRAIEPPIVPHRYPNGRLAWIIGNGEYGSVVTFCPWCGLDLRTIA